MKKKKKLWGGRFSGTFSEITKKISSSIQFDSRLYKQDIKGSIAHARMLNKIGILTGDELSRITRGLYEIQKEIEEDRFPFLTSLEDIHMNIEARLTERIGETGEKLHTGRSRNDQIALDMRLYLLDEVSEIKVLLSRLILTFVDFAEKNADVLIPGYTHLQVGQPVRFSHHLLAYAWKLLRDAKRLDAVHDACCIIPLGVGAMAGVNYPNDREFLRDELGFQDIVPNSMDAVSDRDFILDFLYFASVLGTHLSGFCEELVLWSSSEFEFIRLSEKVTTGSSIMPQKRNPDIAELIRGKTGRLFGNLIALFTVMKGLPMTYNRDMQEDKEPLFDSIDTIKMSMEGMIEMVTSMGVNEDRMKEAVFSNFSTATDVADYLTKKGVPFRKSHEIVGKIVRYCEENNLDFFSLSFEALKKFSPSFDEGIVDVLNPETSTERKESQGSTSKKEVVKQIALLRERLKKGL